MRDLPLYLGPEAEHLLGWIHVTMRLTVLVQGAKGLKHEATRTSVLAALERLKRLLWHGNLFRAFQVLEVLEEAADAEHPAPEEKKVAKWLYDFRQYIEINQPFVSNYGVRYQAGGASPVPLRSRRSTMSSGTLAGEAHGQAATDALDPPWCTPVAPDSDSGARRPVIYDVPAVVSRATSGGRERCRPVAPEMLWSPVIGGS